jgi:dolichyl-phosphate-mannose-protein mannosyltransferase
VQMEFQKTIEGNSNYDANAPKPPFLVTFFQLNQEMLSANARIDQPHHWMSKWWSWPINARGVLYYSTDAGNNQQNLVYLLGNPAVVWLVLAGVLAGFGALFVYCRYRTGQDAFYPNWARAFSSNLTYLCLVWLVNLLPYILVSRAAFVYHYMPALFYGMLATALVVDKLSGRYIETVIGYLCVIVFGVWLMFAPWVYALPCSKEWHASLRWMKGWD